jgi:hypothetical protein
MEDSLISFEDSEGMVEVGRVVFGLQTVNPVSSDPDV